MLSSKGSSLPRDGPRVSCISCVGGFFTTNTHLGSPFLYAWGNQKNLSNSFYWANHVIPVVWNQVGNISKVCLYFVQVHEMNEGEKKRKKKMGLSLGFVILDQREYFFLLCSPVSQKFCHFKFLWYLLPTYLTEKRHSFYKIINWDYTPADMYIFPLAKTFHWSPEADLLSPNPPFHSSYWNLPWVILLSFPSTSSRGKGCLCFLPLLLKPIFYSHNRTLSPKVLSGLLVGFSASSLSFLDSHFHDIIAWLTSLWNTTHRNKSELSV